MLITAWQFIFYTFYRIERRFHFLFNKINPVLWIYRIPRLEAYYIKKYKKEPLKAYNEMFLNKEYGLSLKFTFGFMIILLSCILCLLFNIIIISFELDDVFGSISLVWITGIACVLNIFFLLRTDSYLNSFEEFDIMENREKNSSIFLAFYFQ